MIFVQKDQLSPEELLLVEQQEQLHRQMSQARKDAFKLELIQSLSKDELKEWGITPQEVARLKAKYPHKQPLRVL